MTTNDPNYCSHCGARYFEKHTDGCPLNLDTSDLVVPNDQVPGLSIVNQEYVPISLTFVDTNEPDRPEIGKFWYDRETRLWNFEGDTTGAAKIFARSMFLQFEYMLDEMIEKRAALKAEANVETQEGDDIIDAREETAAIVAAYDPKDPPL